MYLKSYLKESGGGFLNRNAHSRVMSEEATVRKRCDQASPTGSQAHTVFHRVLSLSELGKVLWEQESRKVVISEVKRSKKKKLFLVGGKCQRDHHVVRPILPTVSTYTRVLKDTFSLRSVGGGVKRKQAAELEIYRVGK